MEVTVNTAAQLRITEEEFELIRQKLKRTPNFNELCAFSGMWSEHCSYKNSIKWLKTLPREGKKMLVKAGEENAGLMDIGDGFGVVFKIESHNHPSAIEPFQGAATGVGGIHRDIFTMGARPIASLNSLRFGNLAESKTRHLLAGVVHGIGHYGNCFGVPTVGGEIYFEEGYHTNPLVNAMSVGILKAGETISATAKGIGNPVFFVGSATGKDGIGGASFASADITEESAEDLPAVQVGDPFQEKKLLEACLEVLQTGAVVGMQDMGAAGIICSTAEMSAKGEVGMRIDLDKVPTRQKNMKTWELLLSESQERMLMVVEKGKEDEVLRIFEKWDLPCSHIGEVTGDGLLKFYMHGELEAEIPAYELVLGGGAPQYDREYREPAYFEKIRAFDPSTVEVPNNLRKVAEQLVSLPNIASKRWIYTQYDSMVGTGNASTNDPSDAAIVIAKPTNKGLALTTDCNSRYVFADPYKGAMIAVAEAARNIVCSGGQPLGITNCLNFGNPQRPEIMAQLTGCLEGMADACRALDFPVVSGNVSLYNETNGVAIPPTPAVGGVGLLPNYDVVAGFSTMAEGDVLVLIGDTVGELGASMYLREVLGREDGAPPPVDLALEKKTGDFVRGLIEAGELTCVHDLSDGGLIAAAAEMALASDVGVTLDADSPTHAHILLFGEDQARYLVAVQDAADLIGKAQAAGIHASVVGRALGRDLASGGPNGELFRIPLDHLREMHEAWLPNYMEG